MSEASISVDRASHHYIESIDVSSEAMTDFYESLPFSGKRSLGECHIHFSALAPVETYVEEGLKKTQAGDAVCLDERNSDLYDPQAPPADIVVFLGTFAMPRLDKVSMNEKIKHELVHFAQGKPELSKGEIFYEKELSVLTGKLPKFIFAGKVVLYSGLVEALDYVLGEKISLERLALAGLGASTVLSIIGRKKRQERIAKAENELFELRKNYEMEGENQALHISQQAENSIVTIIPRPDTPPVLERHLNDRQRSSKTDSEHLKLSLKAPRSVLRASV